MLNVNSLGHPLNPNDLVTLPLGYQGVAVNNRLIVLNVLNHAPAK